MTAGKVVAYVPDLMDRSKVSAALGARGAIVSTSDELVAEAATADLVVIDLDRLVARGGAGALDVVAEVAARAGRVIGFGSHVERERLDEARALGCDHVLTRSAFFARLGGLLG